MTFVISTNLVNWRVIETPSGGVYIFKLVCYVIHMDIYVLAHATHM